MSIKRIFEKVSRVFSVEPPVNRMNEADVRYIRDKVRAQTGFDIACTDTREIDVWQNVGLVMPENTPAAEARRAEDVFMAAARERGVEVDSGKILRYVPGPGTAFLPGREIRPEPKRWTPRP